MDSRLKERLKSWDEQIELLHIVEKTYLYLEGSEKSLEGKLYLQAAGRTIDEKNAIAHSSKEWVDFQKGLAESKADYNMQKRILDLRIKAYESEYLTLKIEAEIIHKGKGGQL